MPDLWEPKRRIEEQYKRALLRIMRNLEDTVKGITEPNKIIELLQGLYATDTFTKYAEAEASKMVTSLFTDAGRTWRQAAKRNSKGSTVYNALMHELNGPVGARVAAQIERNARIIKTLPLDVSKNLTAYIAKESQKGRRAQDIAEEIQLKFPSSSKAKANLIARTEVSKTSTALNRARSENLGIDWYMWRTSEDSRVRDSHRVMDLVLVRWNDPPSPEALAGETKTFGHYHAGDIFNCRCYPEPVITLDLIKWPCKVYYKGTIQRITRAQFEKIA